MPIKISELTAATALTGVETLPGVQSSATVGLTVNQIKTYLFGNAVALGSTLSVAGATTLSSTLGVTGAVTLASTLDVAGTSTLAGALVGALTTDATSSTTGAWKTAGGLGVAKALWVGGLANIAGAVTLQSTLAVTGNSTLTGTLALGTSGMTVTGTAVGWGFGVTPSTWSLGKAIEVGFVGGGVWGATQTNVHYLANLYYNSGYKFADTGYATQYAQEGGAHTWLTSSASGTAGNAATMNTLMTLSAAGRLTVPDRMESSSFYGTAGVYIGAENAAHLIDDASNGASSTTLYIGNASINVTSDERIKEGVRLWDGDASALLCSLPVKAWDRYTQDAPQGGYAGGYVGFTAQDLNKVAPWSVNTQGDTGLPWQARYEFLNGIIVKAFQELRAEFNAYKDAHP